MSFLTSKYVPLQDKKGPILTGGLITNSEPWMIPYPNTPEAQNFRVNGRGILPRPGHYQFGADFPGTGRGFGAGIYYRRNPTNDRIIIACDTLIYTPAYLQGGTSATSVVATWKAVTNGSFAITIDGTLRNITGLDFSSITTMANVATIIQTAIRALTGKLETVTWSTNRFIISSANTTSTSAITVTSAVGSGTDISGVGATTFLDAETGVGAVIAAAKKNIVSVNPADGTQTLIETGGKITSTNRMYMVSANDSLYCMNGTDIYARLKDTTYSNPTTNLSAVQQTVGSGKSDLECTSATPGVNYTIKVDGVGTPNTFSWKIGSGAYTTGVAMTGSTQTLGTTQQIQIKFATTRDHTLGDEWTIYTSFSPAFGVWFDNSLWVAGDPNMPNRLFKSTENNADSFTGYGADIFDSPFPVTGIASAGQTLYVFSENNIDMINNSSIKQIGNSLVYTSIPLEANEGTLNHHCLAVFGRDVYYLSKSLKIKQIKPNGMLHYDVIELSHRPNAGIDSIMKSLDPDQSDAFCYVIPEDNLIKWFVKSKGSAFNDVCIVYNTAYNEFMYDTNKLSYAGFNYRTQNFTISNLEPKLYKDEIGHDDDDMPIQFIYTTKHITLSEPTMNKDIWQARTFLAVNLYCEGLKQEIIKDGNVINTRILTDADIPNLYGGMGTVPLGTQELGTDGAISSIPLENISLVIDRGYLNHRGKYYQVKWSIGKVGANFLLQYFGMKIEMKDQFTSSTK